jgi:hypothetical protein
MAQLLNTWVKINSYTATYDTGYFTIKVDKYSDGWIIEAKEVGFYEPYPVPTDSSWEFAQERALVLVKDYLGRRYHSL